MLRTGRIIRVEKSEFKSCSYRDGIKADKQSFYENSDRYRGGNGTYYSNFQSVPMLNVTMVLYEDEYNEKTYKTFDIYDLVRQMNPSWKMISEKRLQQIVERLDGMKLTVDYVGSSISFPSHLLVF